MKRRYSSLVLAGSSLGWGTLFVLLVGSDRCAWGHGDPIRVRAESGKLAVNVASDGTPQFETGRLIRTVDPETISGESPGISVRFPTHGVASGTVLGLDVTSSLRYWNGTAVSPSLSSLEIYSPTTAASFYTVTDVSAEQRGLVWDQYNGSLGWHSHGTFVLENGAAPGLYGLTAEITGTGYATTNPFLWVWRYDPSNVFVGQSLVDGVAALRRSFFPSADLNGDSRVDGVDLGIVYGHWNGAGAGDLTLGGLVDGADVAVVFGLWTGDDVTDSRSTGTLALPEPGLNGWILMVVALVGIELRVWHGPEHHVTIAARSVRMTPTETSSHDRTFRNRHA